MPHVDNLEPKRRELSVNSYLMTDKGLSRNTNQDDVLSVVKENGDSLYVLPFHRIKHTKNHRFL